MLGKTKKVSQNHSFEVITCILLKFMETPAEFGHRQMGSVWTVGPSHAH